MLEQNLTDLRRCAACHDQCQFATLETFAGRSMVFDTSRKAALLIALAEGKLELSDRAVEVIYSGLSSGVQHSVCVYTGDPDGWPDEAVWLRAAREEVVRRGRAPSWAVKTRDAIQRAAAVSSEPRIAAASVHLRGSVSATEDPAGHVQLASIAERAGLGLGLLEGEAGFELFDLGFVDDARDLASSLANSLTGHEVETVVCDSPEAAWMIRKVWPSWSIDVPASVVHTSEWLDGIDAARGVPQGTVGFCDPAVLVRGLGEVDAPRRILDRAGWTVVEFTRSGPEALPVGGYYGALQGDWVTRLASDRLASARRLGMDNIVVASPYDLRSMAGSTIAVSTLHGIVAAGAA